MPNELEIRQTTGFDPPTEDPEIAPDQHHLRASTLNPEHSMRFVTVMWVVRDADLQGAAQDESTNITESPGIRTVENRGISDQAVLNRTLQNAGLLDAKGGLALRVEDDLLLWKEEGSEQVQAAGVSSTEPLDVHPGFFQER